MTSTSTIDAVPVAPIAGGNGTGNCTDSLAALLAQLNITGKQASDVTSTIHGVVQNALVAAVSAISTVSTTTASVPLTPAPTPVPVSAPSVTISPATSGVTVPPVSAPIPPTASAPLTPAPTPVPVPAPAVTVSPATSGITQPQVNVTYDIPPNDAMGPFYWVTRGRRIGIFSTWQQTSSHVIGVSRASFSKVRSVAEGIQLMEAAIDRGETEILP
ncbi:hypothetical protein DEU56DRAFT_907295 [Suillus clintonianus]|uniref:uncharacterized protein n=1 Tax=Suillus clintonianus TaxID=1904413 RepID=UPI001B87DEFB|nr:uncharacterized protein DEU56DRAFT_907295 [Suillus clintonianus]KAG2153816.1 hypothetical protein DEU56DRAFT_907295 [Suillus clintonianus]